MSAPFADNAPALAKRFRVHPVNGKAALIKDWPNAATSDLSVVESWIAQFPTANIGLAPSERGLVIDLDPRHGGWEGLAILEEEALCEIPRETLTTITGGDGRHFFLRLPDGVTMSGSSRKIAAGVEAKSFGAYVVGPGSVHPDTGKLYEFVDPDAPDPGSTRVARGARHGNAGCARVRTRRSTGVRRDHSVRAGCA
jgi:hypothetical protein